jgi:CHAT domain
VDAAELLVGMERGRSRALALGIVALHRPDAPRPAAETRVQFLRQCWRAAVLEGEAEAGERHAAVLRRLEAELLEAHRRQRMRDGSAPAESARDELLRVDGGPGELGPGEALVAYHLDGDMLLACVFTCRAAHKRAWAVPGLQEAIEALRFQIETPRHLGAHLQAHAPLLLARSQARAQALYALLWRPLAGLLDAAERVTVVPHRALHDVPWCALHDGQRWLLESHELILASSASSGAANRMRTWQPPRRVLAMGAEADGLPQVHAELQAIGQAMGARAQLLLGSAASAEALQRLAPGADIVHLACHGSFRADNPAFSALTLADGPLTLHDLREHRLDAALVVLSACETGLSRVAAGDELIGLVRGFTLAGAAAVLATQWAVSDASTARLMGALYRGLAAGVRPAAALRCAQLEAASAGAHPFHWAALTLYGQA